MAKKKKTEGKVKGKSKEVVEKTIKKEKIEGCPLGACGDKKLIAYGAIGIIVILSLLYLLSGNSSSPGTITSTTTITPEVTTTTIATEQPPVTTNPVVGNGSGAENIHLIVLNDERCAECDITMVLGQLKTMFTELSVTELDYGSDEGKDLYTELGIDYLPALLFDDSVKSSDGYSNIENYLEPKGKYHSLNIGAGFDPNAEICDNGIDDNGDGIADCEDPKCASKLICNKDAIVECAKQYDIEADTIIFYHSTGCSWCKTMMPGVENLEKEGYDFYWAEGSDAESMKVIDKCIREYMTADGVPQFICMKNGDIHVGAFTDANRNMDEAALKKFADDCIAS